MPTVMIHAKPLWTDVCPVTAGRTYRLTASGRWWDWFVACGPDGYSTEILSPLARRRRAPNENWFCLMGAIDRDKASTFRIGSERTWTAQRTGVLACFANDLPGMYWNNFGAVTLSVALLGNDAL